MSEIEFITDVRQSPDSGELIVVKQRMAIAGEVNPVGPPIEVRLGRQKWTAQLEPFLSTDLATGTTFGVNVRNTGVVPFTLERVLFSHRFDVSGPVMRPTGIPPILLDDGIALIPWPEDRVGPDQSTEQCRYFKVQPGEDRTFYFPAERVDEVSLVMASLAPRQYWIAAYGGGEELGRLSGEHFRGYTAPARLTLHRRALPAFDALSDRERMAVLTTVAPLRGRQHAQWASDTVRPLEGDPNTFALRTSDGLIVLVTPTKDGGVEILDLFREEALELLGVPGGTEGRQA